MGGYILASYPLASKTHHFLMVGVVGIEPTKPVATVLQTASALLL